MTPEVESKGVDYYKAPDGRTVAIHIKGDFDDYAKFPPYLDTEEAKEHIRTAYAGQAIEDERNTKAHYHVVDERPTNLTRNQVMICQRGSARVGVYTKEGEHLGEAILRKGDIIHLQEGHEVEFLEDGTRLVEIKEGPFPETDDRDKVDLA